MSQATILFEKWPSLLLLARHGQSKANERKEGQKTKGVEPSWTGVERDQDSPLTELGHRQGVGLGKIVQGYRPEYIITSPYLRAKQTAEAIIEGMGCCPKVVVEERVREIEFGVMDGIDRKKFRELYPLEADRRERDGKYYYRPPGGESRPDVRLRVHLVLDTLNRDYVGARVLIVCHSVVVLAFRSLLERWSEDQYLQVDKEDDVKNCGLTVYRRHGDHKLLLEDYNLCPELRDAISTR